MSLALEVIPYNQNCVNRHFKRDTMEYSHHDNQEMDEIDVLALSPAPPPLPHGRILTSKEKQYYCQRCLNHDEFHPRKGHKPYCRHSACSCTNCSMVETRRQLNNKLKNPSGGRIQKNTSGRKERTPNCARCNAHGIVTALRGHKKNQCQFFLCECEKCQLVCHRRDIMAKQIKLRRNQQRARLLGEGRNSIDSVHDSSASESAGSPSPDIILTTPPIPLLQPLAMRPLPMPIMPRLPPIPSFNQFLLTQMMQTNPAFVEMALQAIHNYNSQLNHQ